MNKPTPGTAWVYLNSEPGLWTVGFYTPAGRWEPDSDHNSKEEAAKRVAWLNGSGAAEALPELVEACGKLCDVTRHAGGHPLCYDMNDVRAALAKIGAKS